MTIIDLGRDVTSFHVPCGKRDHDFMKDHPVLKHIPDPVYFLPADLLDEEKSFQIRNQRGRIILVGRAGLKILYIHYSSLDICEFQDIVVVPDAEHALWYIASYFGLEHMVKMEDDEEVDE